MQLGQMSLVGVVLLVVGFFTGSFFLCLAAGFIFSYTESNLGDNVGFLKGYDDFLCLPLLHRLWYNSQKFLGEILR